MTSGAIDRNLDFCFFINSVFFVLFLFVIFVCNCNVNAIFAFSCLEGVF